jgi:hypothetical protein
MVSIADADARISAYVDVVRATEAAEQSGANPTTYRSIAHDWASEAKEGKLKPLLPQGAEDTMNSGVKAQILASAKLICKKLRTASDAEAKQMRYASAAKDLVLAMQVLQPIRYSDIVTVAVVGSQQRQLMRKLQSLWPNLPKGERTKLQSEIAYVKDQPEMLDLTMKVERRVAVVEEAWEYELAAAQGDFEQPSLEYSTGMNAAARTARRLDTENARTLSNLMQG